MVNETQDPTFFNMVSNHPKVRPWIAPPSFNGKIDVAPLFNMGAIGLCTDHGGFMLLPLGYGEYEGHAFFLPQDNRMVRAVSDTLEVLAYVFDKIATGPTDAITMDVPITSQGVVSLLIQTGFENMNPKPWLKQGTEVRTYRLSRQHFSDRMALHSN